MRKLLLFLMVVFASCTKSIELTNNYDPSDKGNRPLISIDDVSISAQQAAFVANTFFSERNETTKNSNQLREISSINPINDTDGSPLMYVINFKEKGFAIISATTTYMPVLAYSDESNFTHIHGLGNEGVTQWMEDMTLNIKNSETLSEEDKFKIRMEWISYEKQNDQTTYGVATKAQGDASDAFHKRITYLRNQNQGYNFYPLSNVSSSMFPQSSTYNEICNLADGYNSPREYTIVAIKKTTHDQIVGPLLTTKWDQYPPYNGLVPQGSVAGCVAIAMAQIMKFHKHPSGYDWNNMQNRDATYDTKRLISDIGVAVNMVYGINSSTAYDTDAKNAFVNNFGYNVSFRNHNLSEVRNEIWKYGRPVYMKGDDTTKGHAWVCDGEKTWTEYTSVFIEFMYGGYGNYNFSDYGHTIGDTNYDSKDLYLHMNWGWRGTDDGWYLNNDIINNSSGDMSKNRMNMYISIK